MIKKEIKANPLDTSALRFWNISGKYEGIGKEGEEKNKATNQNVVDISKE